MRKILEEMKREYRSISEYRKGLEEIIACYQQTENTIIMSSEKNDSASIVFKKIDTKATKEILKKYHIKIR